MTEADQQIFDEDKGAYLPVFSRYKIVLDHGEGAYAYDIDGNKYLDFLGGIAVNVLGHGYAPLVKAISEQAGKMIHCSRCGREAREAFGPRQGVLRKLGRRGK